MLVWVSMYVFKNIFTSIILHACKYMDKSISFCLWTGVTFAAGVLRSVSNSETGRKRLLHTGLVENIATVLKSIETNKLLRSVAIVPMYVDMCMVVFIKLLYGWMISQTSIHLYVCMYVCTVCIYELYVCMYNLIFSS